MKKHNLLKFALISLLIVIPASKIFSQNTESKKPKTIKVKVMKADDNGKNISIDTTINLDYDIDVGEIEKMIQTIKLNLDIPDSIKEMIKTIDINKYIEEGSLDKNDSCKTKVIVKVIDGKTHSYKNGKKKVIIYSDSMSMDNMDFGDDKEIYKIISKEKEEIEIEISDQEEGVMKIKMIDKDSEKVIMNTEINVEEMINDAENSDGKKKIVKYKVNCDGKEIVVISKIVLIDLSEEDISTLEKSGVKDIKKNKLKVEKLNFYPNPNNGKFNLSFDLDSKNKTTISIYNESGKRVYFEELQDFSGKYEKEIDLSGEKKGIYFINVNQNKKSLTKKVVIN